MFRKQCNIFQYYKRQSPLRHLPGFWTLFCKQAVHCRTCIYTRNNSYRNFVGTLSILTIYKYSITTLDWNNLAFAFHKVDIMIKVIDTWYSKLTAQRTVQGRNILSLVLHFSSSKSDYSKYAANISKKIFYTFWTNKMPFLCFADGASQHNLSSWPT